MLKESDVIKAVCQFLTTQGYRVTQHLSESQTGDDIVAVSPKGKNVLIEAKGETSSKPHTSNYGKPFGSSQVLDHVSKAFYRAASYTSKSVLAGIALPKNEAHVRRVAIIQPVLAKLNVEVFWVKPEDGKVEVIGNWKT
jgi:hypothetical protein